MTPKPYKEFESAVMTYKNSVYLHSDIKIKCNENNMGKNERTLIDAAFLCKILTTIKYQMVGFCKKYHIVHVGHMFWETTSWHLKYRPETYTFEIHSSSSANFFSSHFDDKACSCADICVYIDHISSQISRCLSDVRIYAPFDRYKWIYERVQTIFEEDI